MRPPSRFLRDHFTGHNINKKLVIICVYVCVCVHNKESMLWESPHYKTVWALRPLKSSTASQEASRGCSGGLLDDWNNKLILYCLVGNGYYWNPLGWGLLSALILVMVVTCGPSWLTGSQRNSDRLVIREDNSLIWVGEKLLVFWGSPPWFPDLDGAFYIWSAPVLGEASRNRDLASHIFITRREFQFEGRTNNTCTQINKYNEFIYSYICERRICKSSRIDACTQTHLLLVFLLLMKSDM